MPSKAQLKSALLFVTTNTKVLATYIVTSVSVLQIDAARNWVISHSLTHPRLATLAGGVFAIALLLKNPRVQKALHLEQVDPKTGKETTLDITTSQPGK